MKQQSSEMNVRQPDTALPFSKVLPSKEEAKALESFGFEITLDRVCSSSDESEIDEHITQYDQLHQDLNDYAIDETSHCVRMNALERLKGQILQ